jgi:hypothetical protein
VLTRVAVALGRGHERVLSSLVGPPGRRALGPLGSPCRAESGADFERGGVDGGVPPAGLAVGQVRDDALDPGMNVGCGNS